MCMFCKNNITVEGHTTHVVDYKGCVIIVKDVPCIKCDMCGHTYYADDVATRLEELVDSAKTLLQEIAVIEYSQVA